MAISAHNERRTSVRSKRERERTRVAGCCSGLVKSNKTKKKRARRKASAQRCTRNKVKVGRIWAAGGGVGWAIRFRNETRALNCACVLESPSSFFFAPQPPHVFPAPLQRVAGEKIASEREGMQLRAGSSDPRLGQTKEGLSVRLNRAAASACKGVVCRVRLSSSVFRETDASEIFGGRGTELLASFWLNFVSRALSFQIRSRLPLEPLELC